MADNITTSAAFATANMKPAAAGGENIDAVWGRNIADNTGFLYARSFPVYGIPMLTTVATTFAQNAAVSVSNAVAAHFLYRVPGHNRFIGTFSASGTQAASNSTPDSYGTLVWGVYGDLGTYLNTSVYTQTNTLNHTFGSTFSFALDLDSYVSSGSFFEFRLDYSGTQNDFSSGDEVCSHSYTFGTAKFRTTWA